MRTLANPGHAEELLQRLATIRPDSPRRWGRMSAHQMVCHLSDAFRIAIGELGVRSLGFRFRRPMRWLALYVPLQWPRGIRTVPEIDQDRGSGTGPVEFAADVTRLEELMRAFASRDLADPWPLHPIFGPMSARDWQRWAYLHVDHHLRQFGA